MIFKNITLGLFAALLLSTGLSHTALASTTSSVSSPTVSKGRTAVEVRTGYSTADENSGEDERFRSRIHIDHGFTDYYAARLIVSQDKRKNDSYEHDSVSFENRFYFLKADQYGFDMGSKINLTIKDGDKKPNGLAVQFYERIPLDQWEIRLGQLFDRDIGADAEEGINAALRMQATYGINESYRIGLESFSDFGNLSDNDSFEEQNHTFGPVLKGKLDDGYFFETGYRAGLSESAPDHSFKFFMGRNF